MGSPRSPPHFGIPIPLHPMHGCHADKHPMLLDAVGAPSAFLASTSPCPQPQWSLRTEQKELSGSSVNCRLPGSP